MINVNDSIKYVSELFSTFLVIDMDRRRAECLVRVEPDDEQYWDEAVREASYYANRDAVRIADIIVGIAYKRGGANALTTLAEHVSNLNGSDATVTVEDLETPAFNAIGHLLAAYDIDTNVWEVLKKAASAFSKYIEDTGRDAARYIDHISDLVDKEGGSISDHMDREPFAEWLQTICV